MIRKQDLLDRAAEWLLRPEVVEKDYVLGWLLAGLATSDVRSQWVFKGGTCIKKCFFETYRFSEDLDFSLLPGAAYAQQAIRETLLAVTRATHELSGIGFPEELIVVRPRRNKQGQPAFQARIGYRGPLAIPSYPRVLLDLTQHEPVLAPPTTRNIFHPYPDALPEGASVLAYSFDELLSEKARALYERTRPRDLYDVVYLLENRSGAFDLHQVRGLFRQKCEVKGLPCPSATELLDTIRDAEELRSEWEHMLAHQLPQLPKLGGMLLRLPMLLKWIDEPAMVLTEAALPKAPIPPGATVVAPSGIQYWGMGLPIETIRFAGANHLLVEFQYDGKHRIVEPYSLRQAQTGNLLLYGWEQGATHIKAFNLNKISGVQATRSGFRPRFRVELSATGPLSVAPAASPPARMSRSAGRRSASRGRSATRGPTYVFECPYCRKRFKRTRNDSKLNPHKTKVGHPCPGRGGYLLRVE